MICHVYNVMLLHVDQGSGIIGAIGFIISAVSSGIIRSKLKKEAREATIQSTPGPPAVSSRTCRLHDYVLNSI